MPKNESLLGMVFAHWICHMISAKESASPIFTEGEGHLDLRRRLWLLRPFRKRWRCVLLRRRTEQ